jgi:hypothetical protein
MCCVDDMDNCLFVVISLEDRRANNILLFTRLTVKFEVKCIALDDMFRSEGINIIYIYISILVPLRFLLHALVYYGCAAEMKQSRFSECPTGSRKDCLTDYRQYRIPWIREF